jgi:hypothetical protein
VTRLPGANCQRRRETMTDFEELIDDVIADAENHVVRVKQLPGVQPSRTVLLNAIQELEEQIDGDSRVESLREELKAELDAIKAENARQAHTIGRLVAAMKAIVDEVSEAGPKHPVNCIQAVNAMGAVLSDLGLTWADAIED